MNLLGVQQMYFSTGTGSGGQGVVSHRDSWDVKACGYVGNATDAESWRRRSISDRLKIVGDNIRRLQSGDVENDGSESAAADLR